MNLLNFFLNQLRFLHYLFIHVRPAHLIRRRRLTYAIGFAHWKRPLLERLFSERTILFMHGFPRPGFVGLIERLFPPQSIIVWGMQNNEEFDAMAQRRDVPVLRLEDGFVRSVGLGAHHIQPLSLCMDDTSIYFNSRRPSALDSILANHDFERDFALMETARKCLDLMRKHNISKYNLPVDREAARSVEHTLDSEPTEARKRIVCFGQVEDDQSIVYGCDRPLSNNDLIRLAASENPGADIVYKIHPDYLAGKRRPLSDLAEVADLCRVVGDEIPMATLLESTDRAYTLTSLAGFEALMRGVPVTTLGMPFYAGWGLTEDRQATPAWRGRVLTLEQLFAGAYLLYPVYLHPDTLDRSDLPSTIAHIVRQNGDNARAEV